jgi:hypothetical protein
MNNVTTKRSIGGNLKSILRTSANIPLEATDALLEVANDATQISSAVLRGAIPFTKGVTTATINLVIGSFNPNATDEELDVIVEKTTFNGVFDSAVRNSSRAGRTASKAFIDFFEEELEDNTTNTGS